MVTPWEFHRVLIAVALVVKPDPDPQPRARDPKPGAFQGIAPRKPVGVGLSGSGTAFSGPYGTWSGRVSSSKFTVLNAETAVAPTFRQPSPSHGSSKFTTNMQIAGLRSGEQRGERMRNRAQCGKVNREELLNPDPMLFWPGVVKSEKVSPFFTSCVWKRNECHYSYRIYPLQLARKITRGVKN